MCFSFWQSEEIFLFCRVSRPALDSSKPPLHWVLGAFSLGVEQPGHEDDHSHSSSVKFKNEWRYSSIYLHGVWKSEFTLPEQTSFIRVESLLCFVFSSKIIALKKIWNSLALAGTTTAAVPAIQLVECVTFRVNYPTLHHKLPVLVHLASDLHANSLSSLECLLLIQVCFVGSDG